MQIKIKYKDNTITKIQNIDKGDWIDLRSSEEIMLFEGEHKLIPLGMAMELPKGFEAHIAPRSSTFKNYGVLQTNSVGVIDESYNGDGDWWFWSVYATRDTMINKNDRICQFRIIEKQPHIEFVEVEQLGNSDRGGHGSTGIQ